MSSICFVIACNNKTEDKQSIENKKVKQEQAVVASEEKASTKYDITKKNENPIASKTTLEKNIKKSLLINNEKLIVHGATLKKGTKVYSASIQQVGVVKGSIVVVTNKYNETQLTATYKINSIKEIAENTYQLIPKDSEDLYRFYRTLMNSELIDQVELAIDYSGYSPKPEVR